MPGVAGSRSRGPRRARPTACPAPPGGETLLASSPGGTYPIPYAAQENPNGS